MEEVERGSSEDEELQREDSEEHVDAYQCEFCHHVYDDFDACCVHEEACDFRPGGQYEGQDPHEVERRLEAERQEALQRTAEKKRKDDEAAKAKQEMVSRKAQTAALASGPAEASKDLTPLQKELLRRAEERKKRGTSPVPSRRNQPVDDRTPLQIEMERRLEQRRKREGGSVLNAEDDKETRSAAHDKRHVEGEQEAAAAVSAAGNVPEASDDAAGGSVLHAEDDEEERSAAYDKRHVEEERQREHEAAPAISATGNVPEASDDAAQDGMTEAAVAIQRRVRGMQARGRQEEPRPAHFLEGKILSVEGLPDGMISYACISILGGHGEIISEESLSSLPSMLADRTVKPQYKTSVHQSSESLWQENFLLTKGYDADSLRTWVDKSDDSHELPRIPLDGHQIAILVSLHDDKDNEMIGFVHISSIKPGRQLEQSFTLDASEFLEAGDSFQPQVKLAFNYHSPMKAVRSWRETPTYRMSLNKVIQKKEPVNAIISKFDTQQGIVYDSEYEALADYDLVAPDFIDPNLQSPALHLNIVKITNLPNFGKSWSPSISMAAIDCDENGAVLNVSARYQLRLASKLGTTCEESHLVENLDHSVTEVSGQDTRGGVKSTRSVELDAMATTKVVESVGFSGDATWNEEFVLSDVFLESEIADVFKETMDAHRPEPRPKRRKADGGSDVSFLVFTLHHRDKSGTQHHEAMAFLHRFAIWHSIDKQIPLRLQNGHKVLGANGKYTTLHIKASYGVQRKAPIAPEVEPPVMARGQTPLEKETAKVLEERKQKAPEDRNGQMDINFEEEQLMVGESDDRQEGGEVEAESEAEAAAAIAIQKRVRGMQARATGKTPDQTCLRIIDHGTQHSRSKKTALAHQDSIVSQVMVGFPEFAHLATPRDSQDMLRVVDSATSSGLSEMSEDRDQDDEHRDVPPPGTPQLQSPPNEAEESKASALLIWTDDDQVTAEEEAPSAGVSTEVGYIGVELMNHFPCTVSHVHDLRDIYGFAQGQTGCSNPNVFPGDRLLEIDGEAVESGDMDRVRNMLSGKLHSVAHLKMAREIVYGNFATYTINVMRHKLPPGLAIPHPLPANAEEVDEGTRRPVEDIDQAGYIGIELTKRMPHIVTKVDDVLDKNGIVQGRRGYSNTPIQRGDTLLRIDGVPADKVEIEAIRQMLRGDFMSPVEITLSRLEDPHIHYTVTALRHFKSEMPEDAHAGSPLRPDETFDRGVHEESKFDDAEARFVVEEGEIQRTIGADSNSAELERQELLLLSTSAPPIEAHAPLAEEKAQQLQLGVEQLSRQGALAPNVDTPSPSQEEVQNGAEEIWHGEGSVWQHDSRQFQSTVRQLGAQARSMTPIASAMSSSPVCPFSRLDESDPHLMIATTGGNDQFKFSCDSCGLTQYGIRWNCARCQIDTCFMCKPPEISDVEDRLQRVHANLQVAAMGHACFACSCKHCYGVYATGDQLAHHAARCCYNPDLITDHWAERWRCEFCSEIFDNFHDADSHEQRCSFQYATDGPVYGTKI